MAIDFGWLVTQNQQAKWTRQGHGVMRRYGALKGHVWKLMGEECENWLVVTGTFSMMVNKG